MALPGAPPAPRRGPTSAPTTAATSSTTTSGSARRRSPRSSRYLEAENAYTERRPRTSSALRERVFDEIKGRVQETDLGVPTREGDWWYYSRTAEGKQYGIQCRAADRRPRRLDPARRVEGGVDAPGEQVVFDGNIQAEGHDFFSLGTLRHLRRRPRLVYGVDVEGDERYTLHVRDLATGDGPPRRDRRRPPPARRSTRRAGTSSTPRSTSRGGPTRIWRHEVGTARATTSQVFEEADDRYWIGVGLTRSRAVPRIEAWLEDHERDLVLDAADPTGEFRVVWPRREGVEYEIDHAIVDGSDRLLVAAQRRRRELRARRRPRRRPDLRRRPPRGRRAPTPSAASSRSTPSPGTSLSTSAPTASPASAIIPLGRRRRSATPHEVPFDEGTVHGRAGRQPRVHQPTAASASRRSSRRPTVSDLDLATGELPS